ncbi:Vsp/OspC family lipoprotein (plasmid) [Borrelia puertoricensis]|uniref:Vsp/OspC family lipoprotein n=1 Tax=Borrelia puertoricensis TaxID=2756107 RepID=UPI003EB9E3D5
MGNNHLEERMGIENWGVERNNTQKRNRVSRFGLIAILIMIGMIIGCDAGAAKSGQEMATKADGEKIDLAGISEKITKAVAFHNGVKEVHTLVKSIDELAKAIGKKIKNDGIDANAGKNSSLVVGAYNVILDAENKLKELKKVADRFVGMKEKIEDVKNKSTTFLSKLKNQHANIGIADVTDANAEEAIDYQKKPNGTNGAKELGDLNKTIEELLKDANKVVEDTIKGLTAKTIEGKK